MNKCVARSKLYVADTRFFWALYLWGDIESLNRAQSDDLYTKDDAALAFCAHMPRTIIFKDGVETKVHSPRLGGFILCGTDGHLKLWRMNAGIRR